MGLPIKISPNRLLIDLDKLTYYIKKFKNHKWVKYQEHEHTHKCLKLSSECFSNILSTCWTNMNGSQKAWEMSHKCLNLVQEFLNKQFSEQFPPTQFRGSKLIQGVKTIFNIVLRGYQPFFHSHFLITVQWCFPEATRCVILLQVESQADKNQAIFY